MDASFDDAMTAEGDESAAERFFELANAPRVRFAVPGGRGRVVEIRQDPSNATTGGCVWETSYLLALWACRELAPRLNARSSKPPPRCLEVGAGCGLLGTTLAAAGAAVVLTETEGAMANLHHNVQSNQPPLGGRGSATARALHWGNEAQIAEVVRDGGPFDVLLGTDVVYVADMVEPLLRTLWRCAGESTLCWLCGQVRCPDAHKQLVSQAPCWFEEATTLPLDGAPSFAAELECFLLELRRPRSTPPSTASADALPPTPAESTGGDGLVATLEDDGGGGDGGGGHEQAGSGSSSAAASPRPFRKVFTRRGVAKPPYSPVLERYFHQRRSLFSRYDRGVWLDAEGWYSATPEAVAIATSDLLMGGRSGGVPGAETPRRPPSLFVDGFVGVGGNAIQQALRDPAGVVLAVDVDPAKVAMARHNAAVYGLPPGRIQFVVGDFSALAPRLRADVCFLSPPWGGPGYMQPLPSGTEAGGAAAAAATTEEEEATETAAAAATPARFRLSSLSSSAGGPLPVDGVDLFELAARVAPTVGYYLPANTADDDLAALAALHPSRRCERVGLVWGRGRKARERALLVCFEVLAEEQAAACATPAGVHASTVVCRTQEA